MSGWSLLKSVLMRDRSSGPSGIFLFFSSSSFLGSPRALRSSSRSSRSSTAFLKSFCTIPRSPSSSSARRRRRRSLSVSPNRRIGCPFARSRRTHSSEEMLNLSVSGAGEPVSGVPESASWASAAFRDASAWCQMLCGRRIKLASPPASRYSHPAPYA